jgi:cytochrome c biogenesis protein CcdA
MQGDIAMSVLTRIDKAMLTIEQLIVVVPFMFTFDGLRTQARQIGNVADLLSMVQRAIAGVLIVVLGLVVLETLKAYFHDRHVRVEVILVWRLSQPVVIWSGSTEGLDRNTGLDRVARSRRTARIRSGRNVVGWWRGS